MLVIEPERFCYRSATPTPQMIQMAAQSTTVGSTPSTVDTEAVEVFTAPAENDLENVVEFGDAGFVADQQSPPDQRTDATEHDSKLIVCR